ncbi:unnamed protein product [Linum trigynum]|uniref:Uncharacterized protein n=1 Tax=Linum trigynum TaxID=586398 RepID=A0AAV2E0K2_9ROSI
MQSQSTRFEGSGNISERASIGVVKGGREGRISIPRPVNLACISIGSSRDGGRMGLDKFMMNDQDWVLLVEMNGITVLGSDGGRRK